jgi:hypothetical protein
VEGFPEITSGTDANGRFELKDVPSPEVFVSIDGRFVRPQPSGGFYPVLGKSFKSVPGQTVQISMDHKPFNVYLPLITNESIVPVQPGKATEVKMSPSALDRCRELGLKPEDCEKIQLTVPADSLIDRYGSMGSRVAVFPVDSARLPTPLPDGLTHRFDITVQSDAEFFDTPARITFPNVENLPAGSKTLLMSFDHASNRWVAVGTMTVSDDGMIIVPDDGMGIRAPGWHNGTQPGTRVEGGGGYCASESGMGGGIDLSPECLEALKDLAEAQFDLARCVAERLLIILCPVEVVNLLIAMANVTLHCRPPPPDPAPVPIPVPVDPTFPVPAFRGCPTPGIGFPGVPLILIVMSKDICPPNMHAQSPLGWRG